MPSPSHLPRERESTAPTTDPQELGCSSLEELQEAARSAVLGALDSRKLDRRQGEVVLEALTCLKEANQNLAVRIRYVVETELERFFNASPDQTRDSRLALRLSESNHELIKRGAELTGVSVSEFVVNAAIAQAKHDVEERILRWTADEQMRLVELILNPPKELPGLAKAREAHRRMVVSSEK